MSGYLLALSLGPVQEFIAAARRTSDLTAGSDLLVEIAKKTARAIETSGGTLIFPASVDSDGPNKILAELPDGVEPRAVAEAAKTAARDALKQEWQAARTRIQHAGYDLNAALAEQQIAQFLEVYAAWTPLPPDGEYAEARAQVDGLLAARKNLRNFASPPEDVAPPKIYAKSPLDPAFECVLNQMPPLDAEGKDTRFLRLKRTEFLDAVSLLKRVRGREKGQVPSTRDLARRQSVTGFLKGDWSDEDDEPEGYGYFAILVADGDNMGARLKTMHRADEHRAFSQTLAGFAGDAKTMVAAHDGYLVYAGGDDVLALLPVKTVVVCAQDLAAAFNKATGATLSAGVVVVHYRQPLSLSLQMARAAEKRAKENGRDSLTLALHTRGGTPVIIPRKWAAWLEFETWLAAFRNKSLTRGVAYELRDLAREFENAAVPDGLLGLEAKRIWGRKKPESGKTMPAFPDAAAASANTLNQFADLLVAARFLTAKGDNTNGEDAG